MSEAAGAAGTGATGRPLRAGVIGVGALGFHHTRLLAALPGAELVGIHDADPAAARRAAEAHGARVFADLAELTEQLEVAVVAVPTVVHAEVAVPLLERGVHCLVEKPIAPDLADADRILRAAGSSGAVLGVGHVEFYNPAVQVLLAAALQARFVEVQRLAQFTLRSLDVDVVKDLMIHDLQILHALDRSPLAEVRATGIDVLSARVDIANARLAFASGCVANVTASRVSADRVRKLRVFSPASYYSLDYQAQEIKGYRLLEAGEAGEGAAGRGAAAGVQVGGRAIVPADLPVEPREPLRGELEAFLARCRGETDGFFVDGAEGRQALATALAVMAAIEGVGA
jgi:predicted dehydrogenase